MSVEWEEKRAFYRVWTVLYGGICDCVALASYVSTYLPSHTTYLWTDYFTHCQNTTDRDLHGCIRGTIPASVFAVIIISRCRTINHPLLTRTVESLARMGLSTFVLTAATVLSPRPHSTPPNLLALAASPLLCLLSSHV